MAEHATRHLINLADVPRVDGGRGNKLAVR